MSFTTVHDSVADGAPACAHEPAHPEDVACYAAFIGVDLGRYPQLRNLVEAGLSAPLPEGWQLVSEEGGVCYKHTVTGTVLDEHPYDRFFRRRAEIQIRYIDQGEPEQAAPDDTDDMAAVSSSPLFGSCRQQPGNVITTYNTDEWGGFVAPSVREEPPPSTSVTSPRAALSRLSSRAVKPPSSSIENNNSSQIPVAPPQPKIRLPPEFICPITADVMTDPVVIADGFSYERKAIETWFAHRDTSPMTGAVLVNRAVFPNTTLRVHIREFLAAYDVVHD